MPTINFSFADFGKLLGKKLTIDEFEELLALYVKAEIEKYDKESNEISLKLDDTNLPYLWCAEGIARFLRRILGIEKGSAKLKLLKGNFRIIAENSIKDVRPFITAFVAKGKNLDDYSLKQLVQLQEKFCDGYGRRRQKVSIGLYSYKRIIFPVHYRAVPPNTVKFIPLGMEQKVDLNNILEHHPKGQQYGWILKGKETYPLLVDSQNEVLSFPPIINSNFTGKLETGDSEVLFEATGNDEESVNLAASIFAQNLAERGFEIYSVEVDYGRKKIVCPIISAEKVKITAADVKHLIGIKLSQAQLKSLLLKAGYDVSSSYAVVPPYRADILHPVDVLEDVAIAYGFDKIPEQEISGYTVGRKDRAVDTVNAVRQLAIGMGFQEVFSHILIDRKNAVDISSSIMLENFMSETYSALRDSLMPQLLDVFSSNKHQEYPQLVFEEGLVVKRVLEKITEHHIVTFMSSHSKADFTGQKQCLNALFSGLGLKFSIKAAEHAFFIKGRCAEIIQNGKPVGIIGELSPEILSRWELEMPASCFELDLSAVFGF
jgi:phenylalanyl-tRNA synthetase beta chain